MYDTLCLSGGRHVHVHEVFYTRTYANSLGSFWLSNDFIVERLMGTNDGWYGREKRFLVPHLMEPLNISNGPEPKIVHLLPSGIFRVRLASKSARTTMNVVWLTSESLDQPLLKLLERGLRDLPWSEQGIKSDEEQF